MRWRFALVAAAVTASPIPVSSRRSSLPELQQLACDLHAITADHYVSPRLLVQIDSLSSCAEACAATDGALPSAEVVQVLEAFQHEVLECLSYASATATLQQTPLHTDASKMIELWLKALEALLLAAPPAERQADQQQQRQLSAPLIGMSLLGGILCAPNTLDGAPHDGVPHDGAPHGDTTRALTCSSTGALTRAMLLSAMLQATERSDRCAILGLQLLPRLLRSLPTTERALLLLHLPIRALLARTPTPRSQRVRLAALCSLASVLSESEEAAARLWVEYDCTPQQPPIWQLVRHALANPLQGNPRGNPQGGSSHLEPLMSLRAIEAVLDGLGLEGSKGSEDRWMQLQRAHALRAQVDTTPQRLGEGGSALLSWWRHLTAPAGEGAAEVGATEGATEEAVTDAATVAADANEADAAALGRLLFELPSLSPAAVGDLLSSRKPLSSGALASFVACFDFRGLSLVDALRLLFAAIKCSGEAQKVDQLMQAFAKRYYTDCPGPFADEDAVYVMAFSTMLLNTDAHNAAVRNKMSLEAFMRNNRRINNGADLPAAYLAQVYAAVHAAEIKAHEETATVSAQSQAPFQGAPFQGAPFQGAPFQGAPFQGAPPGAPRSTPHGPPHTPRGPPHVPRGPPPHVPHGPPPFAPPPFDALPALPSRWRWLYTQQRQGLLRAVRGGSDRAIEEPADQEALSVHHPSLELRLLAELAPVALEHAELLLASSAKTESPPWHQRGPPAQRALATTAELWTAPLRLLLRCVRLGAKLSSPPQHATRLFGARAPHSDADTIVATLCRHASLSARLDAAAFARGGASAREVALASGAILVARARPDELTAEAWHGLLRQALVLMLWQLSPPPNGAAVTGSMLSGVQMNELLEGVLGSLSVTAGSPWEHQRAQQQALQLAGVGELFSVHALMTDAGLTQFLQSLLRVLDECVYLVLRNPAAGDLPAATVTQLLVEVLVATIERPPTALVMGYANERLEGIIGLHQIPPGCRLALAAKQAHARLAAARTPVEPSEQPQQS